MLKGYPLLCPGAESVLLAFFLFGKQCDWHHLGLKIHGKTVKLCKSMEVDPYISLEPHAPWVHVPPWMASWGKCWYSTSFSLLKLQRFQEWHHLFAPSFSFSLPCVQERLLFCAMSCSFFWRLIVFADTPAGPSIPSWYSMCIPGGDYQQGPQLSMVFSSFPRIGLRGDLYQAALI